MRIVTNRVRGDARPPRAASSPPRRHRAFADGVIRQDPTERVEGAARRVPAPSGHAHGRTILVAFAVQVRRHLHGGLLTYSDRRRLIRFGQSLGLTAFHANLVIASVQHEGGRQMPPTVRTKPPRAWVARAAGFAGTACAFVVVQSVIVAGAWYVLS